MSFMREITKTTGDNRVGLWRPSFVKVDSRLFVFGGGGNATSDLHVLDLRNMKWETIQVNTSLRCIAHTYIFVECERYPTL
jgi:hypothetical protein